MDKQLDVCIRYSADLPVLRYIVPFTYSQNGMSYDDAKKMVLATQKWILGKRKNLVPSTEEDLYDHVYESFIDDNKTDSYDTNIGTFFIPKEPSHQSLIYSFFDDGEKKYEFSISDVNIFIFKTGVGFYVYEASLPHDNPTEQGYVKSLTIEQLILFQNRFKELNVVRGYLGKKANSYCFYPKDYDPNEFYSLGREIAINLNRIFGDVFFYPPRVNEILKHKWLNRIKEERKKRQKEQKRINHKRFDEREDFWKHITVADYDDLLAEERDDIFIVPDKALLYSYVAMNTSDNLESEADKEIAFSQFYKNLYYLTRGYKPSYKVSDNSTHERSQMFQRHENDFWDASLEGVGDFVLIYDDLFETTADKTETNKPKQKKHLFFDGIRPLEMRGDYFILYILLLYQHYSVVYFSKKIAETIPMQKETFLKETEDNEIIYRRLRDLKLDVNMFFANCMFESVGQITDMCTIYSFIERKMNVKKNIESLQRGINDLDALREEIQSKQKAEKDAHVSKILSVIGILAIVSIVFDAVQFFDWFKCNILPLFQNLWDAISSIDTKIWIPIIIGFTTVLLIAGIYFFTKKRAKKKIKSKKKRG